ncbi:MAG: hypothetical protein WCI41_03715 [bacterium]
MAKYGLKEKARKLRREGFTINNIKDELGLSKSTVSMWCKDIVLTEAQYKKIKKEHIFKTQKGRLLGAEMNKNKRLNAIKEADVFGKNLIKKISKRELLLIAVALYWAEGSKSEGSTGFQFVNSDPEMILCVKRFLLECLDVKKDDLVCSIQINEIHNKRIDQVLNFWKNLLQLQDSQFRRPYFIKTKTHKIYDNYDTYYGICKLIVRRSSGLKYKMLALIKAIEGDILSM